MKNDVLRVRSLHVLQRLLAPLVALHISRRRRQKAVKEGRPLPKLDALKSSPLFAKWLAAPLQNWLSSGVVESHDAGTAIAFPGEPRKAADVFWVLSGKLAQIPNKAELRACASDLVHLPRDQPKTGPLILPSHFVDASAKKSLPPPTAAQERLTDSLGLYHAGQLVDVERLLLGGRRLRGLRCQSAVVVLRLSVAACLREMQTLPGAAHSATMDAARDSVQRGMAQFVGAPPTPAIALANPVLAALPPAVLRSMRVQLRPFVFLQGEVVSPNIFAAEWMYILTSGEVRIDDGNGAKPRRVTAPYTAIGESAFVPTRMPDRFDQTSRATAAVYCETWGVPIAVMASQCDAAARLPCTMAATQLLRGQGTGRLPIAAALRAYPCFSDLSETAVVAIGRALQLRVCTPGETLSAAGRIPAFGLLVIAGDVRVHRGTERDEKPLPPGQALCFCESLVKMCVGDAVVSQGSAIVLLGTPGLLFEAMESAGAATEDTQLLLRHAQAYVDHRYGAGVSEISRAQCAAAERVKDYKRRQEEEMHDGAVAAPLTAAASIEVLQNELLASLFVQLHALHPSNDDAVRFEFFRASRTATRDDNVAALPPPPPRRSTEFFSLDAQGNLVTREATDSIKDVEDVPPTAAPPAPSRGSAVLPPSPLPFPPPPQRQDVSVRATTTPRSAPAAPTAQRAAARPAARAPTLKSPSPRVASLRAAATRMKDEADGVDRRKEHRSLYARTTPR